ncbi:MAG: glycosyltransferase family 10 [Verrucomicrobiota bacterium]
MGLMVHSLPPHTLPELKVRLNMDHSPGNLRLLSPGGNARWGRCCFDINPAPGGEADYGIVFANARPLDRFACAPENTLFIAAEPLEKKLYPRGYYRQFHRLVDTHAESRHPRLEINCLGMCWHVGLDLRDYTYRYGYDHLDTLARPPKQNRISVVCSNAARTPGQRRRLGFLAELKRLLGDRMVHFGRGFEPINDKMDAILPYRFNLVLENCQTPNYWTEKLSDAYLGWAFPFYVGCPNVGEFFNPDAFEALDMGDPAKVARLIETRLDTADDDGVESAAITVARRQILDAYNPFAWCARWAEAWHRPLPAKPLVIRSHRAFRPFPQDVIYRLRSALAERKHGTADSVNR